MSVEYGSAEQVIAELGWMADRLSTNPGIRLQHGKDESGWDAAPPDAVVFPETTEEVSRIVALCAEHRVPVIAFGTGTAVEGQVQALQGGISIDTSRMNRIVEVHAEDLDCVVQPGVTRVQLNQHLRDTGLFFPVDPGADASLGGMVSTRASGTNAVRYGTMRENVMALTVVMADGRIVRTGSRTRKSSAGYDLTRLFVGAEGTLGIITEITLRLHGLQEAISSSVCCFERVDDAVNTVIETIQLGVPVARIELLDALQMRAINQYSKTDYPEAPHLFLEFHGSESGVTEQAETVQEIAAGHNGSHFQWATQEEDRNRLWQARHDAFPSALQLQPGTRPITTDVCVPISRLADCIRETAEDIAAASMPITLLGHVGDGNFHLVIMPAPDDPAQHDEGEALNHRLVRRALAMGGTCTGEHGIGIGKMEFLEEECPEAVEVMRQIKRALDPQNIMNPGKIFKME